jgi:hypothetical protein
LELIVFGFVGDDQVIIPWELLSSLYNDNVGYGIESSANGDGGRIGK